MNNIRKINGLIAATFTPFTSDGKINLDIIPAYAARMKQQGLAGVFINGSSGEGVLLSVSERVQLAEAWAQHAAEDFRILVHVGSTSVEIAKELATHCQKLSGISGVASMAPNFFPSSDVAVIADYCLQVAQAAPDLPFYYYHLPVATGTHIKVHELLTLAAPVIPNLAGVKFTHHNFMDMNQCIQLENGRFDILHGHDEVLLSGLILNVKGAVGTTFNFIPGVYHNIIQAYECGDFEAARRYQLQSIEIVSLLLKYENAIVGGKAIMKLAGLDCGPCRTPLRNLSGLQMDALREELERTSCAEELFQALAE